MKVIVCNSLCILISVIASAAKQSRGNNTVLRLLDCFAALAMTDRELSWTDNRSTFLAVTIRSLAIAFLLTACDYKPLSTDLPIYQTAGKIKLPVAVIKHQVLPQSPELPELRAPLLLTPPQAIQDWATQRLEPVSQDGIAIIILKNYSVKEILIASESSLFTSWMDTDKERVEATLGVTIEFYDRTGKMTSGISSTVTHGRNFEYDITLQELQGACRKELMLTLDLLDMDITPRLTEVKDQGSGIRSQGK